MRTKKINHAQKNQVPRRRPRSSCSVKLHFVCAQRGLKANLHLYTLGVSVLHWSTCALHSFASGIVLLRGDIVTFLFLLICSVALLLIHVEILYRTQVIRALFKYMRFSLHKLHFLHCIIVFFFVFLTLQ